MVSVKDNLDLFNKYNELQSEIDKCNGLISQLKRKRENDVFRALMGGYDLQENLGAYLHGKIGTKIISLIEAEVIVLKAEQDKIEIKC